MHGTQPTQLGEQLDFVWNVTRVRPGHALKHGTKLFIVRVGVKT